MASSPDVYNHKYIMKMTLVFLDIAPRIGRHTVAKIKFVIKA